MSEYDFDENMPNLREDLESLRDKGLIDIVGINDEGEWLYNLSPTSKQLVEELRHETDDIWGTIALLMENMMEEERDL
jgi:DNA-binding transcriptional ArsR family regulator